MSFFSIDVQYLFHIKSKNEQAMGSVSASCSLKHDILSKKFCYGVYNQRELFICPNLMVKNREVPIDRYFK
jgi:hypothetical protein